MLVRGQAFNTVRQRADLVDLKAILLTHLHVDHVADLPAFVKGAYFTNRKTEFVHHGTRWQWVNAVY